MDDLVIDNGLDMVQPFDFSMIQDESVDEVVVDEEVVEDEEVIEDEEVEEEETSEDEEEEVVEDEEAVMTDEDGEEVDYENYEISLPSGEEVKLAQLVQGYKDAEALTAEKEQFEAIKTEFESKAASVASMMEMALLESQQAVDSYEDFDWAKEAKEDPANYAEHREYFEHHRRRVKDVQKAYNEQKEAEAVVKKEEDLKRAREASAQLVRDLPGWGDEMYNELCHYALEYGFDKDYILDSVSPAFFKMLHKMKAVEKGAQKVTAKVKKVGAPKKVIKNQTSKPKPSKDAEREAAVKRAMKSGNPADMFQFLVD